MPLLPSFFVVQVAFAPLPASFMQALRQIEIETAVGQASILRLHFDLSRTFIGDLDVMAFDIFQPMFPLSIRLSGGLGMPQCLVNGYIKDAQAFRAATSPAARRSKSSRWMRSARSMATSSSPSPGPTCPTASSRRRLFAKYGMLSVVVPTPPTRTMLDTTTTQRAHDAAFLMQLARRNDYELYVQPDPVSGLDLGHFHPPLILAPPQGVLSVDFGTETNLNRFDVAYDMLQPTGVVAAASDPRTASWPGHWAPLAIEPPMGREPTLTRILPAARRARLAPTPPTRPRSSPRLWPARQIRVARPRQRRGRRPQV